MFDVSLKDTWTDFSQLNVEFNNYFNTHDGDIANELQKVFQISRSKPEIHTVPILILIHYKYTSGIQYSTRTISTKSGT